MKFTSLGAALLCLALFPAAALCGEYCSAPLAAAQAGGFTLGLSTAVPEEKAFRLLEAGSSARLAQLRLLLEPFSAEEEALLKKAALLPPYLVTRVKFDKLRSILSGGALLSPELAFASGAIKEKPFTPAIEASLFGGHGCVFASYGPYTGRLRYGDVVFRLDHMKLAGRSWGSFSSGWHFLRNSRGLPVEKLEEVSPDDIAAFTGTVFAGRDLPAVYPLMIISFLRARPEEERRALAAGLLSAPDGPSFYAIVDDKRLGYMEVKINSSVPLDLAAALEVPPGLLAEALSWPEAAAYKDRIR
ncbi:MAG: hypothetical protein HY550_03005, partial [Elusimicrobia bacterium]|nr:hypothetical protein [Elusimicrobiota bacterium]